MTWIVFHATFIPVAVSVSDPCPVGAKDKLDSEEGAKILSQQKYILIVHCSYLIFFLCLLYLLSSFFFLPVLFWLCFDRIHVLLVASEPEVSNPTGLCCLFHIFHIILNLSAAKKSRNKAGFVQTWTLAAIKQAERHFHTQRTGLFFLRKAFAVCLHNKLPLLILLVHRMFQPNNHPSSSITSTCTRHDVLSSCLLFGFPPE